MTGSKPGRRQQPPGDSGAAFAYPCATSITSIIRPPCPTTRQSDHGAAGAVRAAPSLPRGCIGAVAGGCIGAVSGGQGHCERAVPEL